MDECTREKFKSKGHFLNMNVTWIGDLKSQKGDMVDNIGLII